MATMAHLMKIKERSVYAFESFREFTDDPAMLHAFQVTQDIPVPKWEEWGAQVPQGLERVGRALAGPGWPSLGQGVRQRQQKRPGRLWMRSASLMDS